MKRPPCRLLTAAASLACLVVAACESSPAADDDADDVLSTADAADTAAPNDTATAGDTAAAGDTDAADTTPAADITLADVPTGAACPCEPACPTAVIDVAQGDTVTALTTLRLSGANSTGASDIVHYEWTVQQPQGSQSVFLPSAGGAAPDVTLPAHVAGNYDIGLVVTDADGARSCRARQVVFVVPPEPVYVELVWDTPGDPDQTDVGIIDGVSAGSDLDLHLMHPYAVSDSYPEGWFSPTYDIFWGTHGPARWDDASVVSPELVRDDTDGAGPEAIHIAEPTDGVTYRVGVHYWDDWGYGPSFATVRIYIEGTLAFELANVELVNVAQGIGDLWEVATIAWPSGEVNAIPDPDVPQTPFIRPGYHNPEWPPE